MPRILRKYSIPYEIILPGYCFSILILLPMADVVNAIYTAVLLQTQ